MANNLKTLTDACVELCSEFDQFWMLAGLTDCSYEEGTRNRHFLRAVRSYSGHGVTPTTLDCLGLGINGNLKRILQNRHPELGAVRRTKGKGQDLSFEADEHGRPVKIEIKLVYDCTMTKYYRSVAADWKKLERVRAEGFGGDLFVGVLFVQMPGFTWPAGRWYGNKRYAARSKYLVHCGIREQFHELSKHLTQSAAWPGPEPYIHALAAPQSDTMDAARKRFEAVFQPDSLWHLDPAVHFAGAAVGAAVWQIP